MGVAGPQAATATRVIRWRTHPACRVGTLPTLFHPAQQLPINLALNRAAVEVEAPCRLLITAGSAINQGAIARKQLVRGDASFGEIGGDVIKRCASGGAQGTVITANQDILDTLLQLAVIAGPGVVAAEIALDPLGDVKSQTRGLGSSDAARHV